MLEGGIYVSEAVGNSMIEKFASGGAYISANPIDSLTNRELQVLHMIGKGLSTRQTAEALNLSVKTVESHRQRIKRKLSLRTSAQLMQYAVNWYAGREPGQKTLLRRLNSLRPVPWTSLQACSSRRASQGSLQGWPSAALPRSYRVARAMRRRNALLTRRHADLAATHRRNRAIVEASGEGVLELDNVGHVRYANPAAAKLLGYELEELLGSRLS